MKIIDEKYPLVGTIVKKIIAYGGRPYLVGGAVRDMVMGVPIKDVDIEVHELTEQDLEEVLKKFGRVSVTGKSFGVLRVHGLDVDWSLPRSDSAGRKPIVTIDPLMTIEGAARRRDLTMNAMAIDLKTEKLIDPFGGMRDIENRLLRSPDLTLFGQDPLRFYRVMHFVSRFEMFPDNALHELCSRIEIEAVSRERIEEECKKMLLLSRHPSLGLRWINSIGRLQEVFPELAATLTVEQNPRWHPEGTVFEHSMQALDAAARIVQSYDNDHDKLLILYAALCHDLGKVTTTTVNNGVIKSIGHEREVESVKKMMRRITHDGDLIAAIVALVKYHMIPLQLVAQRSHRAAYKRLANKLGNALSLSLLSDLVCADKCGRNGASHEPLPGPCAEVEEFREKAKKAGVFEYKEAPVLIGADMLPYVAPGPEIGKLLARAYDLQINEGITDKSVLLRRVMRRKMK